MRPTLAPAPGTLACLTSGVVSAGWVEGVGSIGSPLSATSAAPDRVAAVVAQPDEKWGEVPAAFIKLKDGMQVSADEVIEFCRNNMARFKVPKKIVFGELPKTSTGKIQKFVLRNQVKEN